VKKFFPRETELEKLRNARVFLRSKNMGGETCKVLEPLNLLFISPENLQGLHFSATMPKAKM